MWRFLFEVNLDLNVYFILKDIFYDLFSFWEFMLCNFIGFLMNEEDFF